MFRCCWGRTALRRIGGVRSVVGTRECKAEGLRWVRGWGGWGDIYTWFGGLDFVMEFRGLG